MDCLLFGTTIK
uniref:REC114 meiotic recombination protein n=3 Tax=Boreoeutheria TaxID=1437010 RepID=A0A287CTA7_ICTTR